MIASLATTRSDVELLTLDLAGFDRVLGECRQARCGGRKDQVPVLIVRDRSGATADFMLDAIDKKAIEPPLRTVLKKMSFSAAMVQLFIDPWLAVLESPITPSIRRNK